MRILLLGGGAREHALAWKLAQSDAVRELLMLPGNPGMERLGTRIEGVAPTDVGAVAALARQQEVDLVVVGPEAPLAAGVGDAVRRHGIAVFGPDRAGARLESSKAFAKEIMAEAGVPTGDAHVFTEPEAAIAHLESDPGPYVVKADGLAGGKGVLVTEDRRAALDWVDRCFSGAFGEAGSTIVIEEYLEGPEVSVFAVCDGKTAVGLEPARDYKRLLDGDRGPNTGGMGCYSPVHDLHPDLVANTLEQVVRPVLDVMAHRGLPYIGFLYTGLILTAGGPKVLEFNCRLGDPETQVVLPRLESDLAALLATAAQGEAPSEPLAWRAETAVDVVLAAAGYPTEPRRGDTIQGLSALEDDPSVLVFHAGTSRVDGRLVTAGGRVLNVVGRGPDVTSAQATAYGAVEQIRFKGMQFRTDIAQPA